jgi:Carboxypeptidase regulatory-like domain/TonB dependent receptor-like, beta-barrel
MTRRALLTMCLALGLATSAAAQLATQTALVGTVSDTSRAVLPGATVVAVNTGTQDKYEATTNEQGYFNIQFVRPGPYEITVSLAGFQTFKVTGVEVATNQIVRRDATMQLGGVSETVTVASSATLLATDSPTIAERIDERAVQELPISGRNVWSLAGTTPGVLGGTNSFTGAGQRNIQNSLSMDGINTAANLLTSTSMRPISDAVTEVQVQTGSTSAEYGSYLGVHVNVVTKSGTNNPHGSVFEYLQHSDLASRGLFEDRSTPKNPRRRDQFGFQSEGPVFLPKVYDGRNRTFYMMAYEGTRLKETTTSVASVPTALMREGNFTEISTAIRNPFTGQPFAGNIVPQSQISLQARNILEMYPLPNRPGTGSNLVAAGDNKNEQDQILTRVDQNIGNKIRLYVRYNWQDQFSTNIGAIPVAGTGGPNINHNMLIAYTHTLTNRLLNDFRVGYHRVNDDSLNSFEINGLANAGASLGIPGFDGDVRYNNAGIPTFTITGFSGLGGGGTNWYQFDKTFQFANVLAYTSGSHNIRAGIDARRLETGRRAANNPRGGFTFNGDMTGYSVADLIVGLPRNVTTPVNQIQGHVGGWRTGTFINDTWQVTRNLTLNLGLRYELDTPAQTYEGYASMLNADQTALIPTSFPAVGFEFHESNNKDFAPRVGMAYRLGERTVFRAGYGIYYNPNQMNTFTFLTNNPPLAAEFTFVSLPSNPTLSLSNPYGEVGPGGPPNVTTPNRHLPNARKDQWSLDLQREILNGTALDLQYVGSHTKNLDRSFFNNTPAPGAGAIDARRPNQSFRVIRTIQNDLYADYHAMSIILRQRLTHGLQANAHYTWSITKDIGTNSNGGSSQNPGVDPYRQIEIDYARADWDVPHRFVATYIYDLPFFKTSDNPVLKYALSGWQVGGITTLESGRPFGVTIQGDRANTGIGSQRPDLVGAIPTLSCRPNPTAPGLVDCIDPTAFATPALYTYGNAPRNLVRGLSRYNTDLSLVKSFPIGGKARFEVRADVFNLFDQVTWGTPNGVFGTANFGRVTSADPMRRMELGGKFVF